MSLGVALMWPAVALSAFLALTGVVVALGVSSTARYEFERNGAREQRQSAEARSAHPAGSRLPSKSPEAPDGETRLHPPAVGVAALAVEAPQAEGADGRGWWLVADPGTQVLAGPFRDRVDADWAALTSGVPAAVMYGMQQAEGGIARRPSPEERAWLAELGEQLDRLPDDWNDVLSDTDPLTTLVVEVAAALVESGLPLHDSSGESPGGGVCLLPAPDHGSVLISWRPHDRMGLVQVRGPETDAAVQSAMNAAIADILEKVGFVLQPFGESGSHLVTAIRP